MSNAILINPFPTGADTTQHSLTITGSIVLCGAAVATGEPLNFGTVYSGVGYNEINNPAIASMITGGTAHGPSTALVTTFSGSGTVVTATAANNFFVGQSVTFLGNTSTLGLLLNGTSAVIASASATQFTFASTATGTGTSEVGLAVTGRAASLPVPGGPLLTATVTALSASGSVLTVTAANTFLPGAQVTVSVATGTLGPKLTMTLPVLQSTGTAFTAQMPSALTGTTGTGTATGANPPMPYDVRVESALASGYIYQYNQTFGTLFGFAQTNAAAAGDPLGKLAAAAYPAGALADVVRYTAKFARG
jgi:hypothetical protein